MAIDAGAAALGLVSHMPSGPGVITDEQVAEIAAALPPGVDSFLLTSLQDVEAIAAQQRAAGAHTLQLVDALPEGAHAGLRAALPGVKLVQVIHVTGPESIAEAEAVAPFVDALLLDSGNPALEVKELGGTGRRHDWELSRRIRAVGQRAALPRGRPAPGQRARGGRDGRAVRARCLLGPALGEGFDLDPDKLERFMAAARG